MRRGVSEDLLRPLVPQVLGTLLRCYGPEQFDVCEDSVQEAVLQVSEIYRVPDLPPGVGNAHGALRFPENIERAMLLEGEKRRPPR